MYRYYVCFQLSWLIIDFSTSATLLLLGRFLSGVSCGVCFVQAPVYISEIADQSIRGLLAAGILHVILRKTSIINNIELLFLFTTFVLSLTYRTNNHLNISFILI